METRAGEFFVNFAQNNKYLRQKLWVSPLMNQFIISSDAYRFTSGKKSKKEEFLQKSQ